MKFNIKRKLFVLSVSCILLATFSESVQAKNKELKKSISTQILPLDTAVRTGKLANGFTYYIRHNEEPKDKVLMYLVTKAGSILEDDDQQGLAHFMEHMSFNGTAHYPKNELVSSLQKIGVRFGSDLNAYTGFDETVYQLPVPIDKPENVEMGLQIMRDWAHEATLDPKEIDDERGVILEEKRLGKGVEDRMSRQFFPVLFNNSRYSQRLPIGVDTVLTNFKAETIRRFYTDWYRPNLQALIVVGNIDVNQMEQTIKAKFGDLKNPEKEKKRVEYSVPLTGKNQFLQVTDKEKTVTQVLIFMKSKETILKTAADYHNSIVIDLFNAMISSRIQELRQQADPAFLGGSIQIGGFMGGLDAFNVSVTANPGQLERGFKAVWREVQRANEYGFRPAELEQAKANYIKSYETALREKDKTESSDFVKEYQQYFLKGYAAPGISYEYLLVKDILAKVSLVDVEKTFKNYFKDTDRDIILLAPEKDKSILPNEQEFNGWMKGVKEEKLQPYKEEPMAATLLKMQPKPGKIVGEVKDPRLGLITYTLSNGIKVIVKKTDFKNDDIQFSGYAPGGTSLYPDSIAPTADRAYMITWFGVGNYNPTQLKKYLAGKEMSVRASIDLEGQSFNGQSVNKDLRFALEQIYACFMEPRKDTAIFKADIASRKAALVNRYDNPNAVFLDTIIGVKSEHNPRRMGDSYEKINKTNLDKAFEIYKERFADASGFTFVFVGSIDTVTLKPLLEKYLASLPGLHKNEKAINLNYRTPRGLLERTVYAGKEQKATVELTYTGQYFYDFAENLKLDALKEVLQIRVLERLREEEGGVYSPQVLAGGTPTAGGYFNFIIQFGCSPQNVDKLIASAKDEIRKIKLDGPSQVNLDKFKAEDAKSMEERMRYNGYWSSIFHRQLMWNQRFDDYLDYDNVLKSITVDDVKQIANKYLTGENIIKMVLMPEKTDK